VVFLYLLAAERIFSRDIQFNFYGATGNTINMSFISTIYPSPMGARKYNLSILTVTQVFRACLGGAKKGYFVHKRHQPSAKEASVGIRNSWGQRIKMDRTESGSKI